MNPIGTRVQGKSVLTNRSTAALSRPWSAARVGVALCLSALTLTAARAGGVESQTCVVGPHSYNCVSQSAETLGDSHLRFVPDILNEADRTQMLARDQKWLARCHPTLQRDRYGVARYHYAAAGCEFGIGAD